MQFEDRIWQVAWQADANFPFFWNKDVFDAAGLDPDRPPTTVAEAHELSRRITKRSGGRVTRIGMIPWDLYGVANALYTWGWAFGGTFYDAERDEVTPDHEYVVKALEWIVGCAKEVGGADNVSAAPPGTTLHYFGSGNVGMSALVSANYADIRTAKPDMQVGTTSWPYQPPGATQPGAGAWLSGRAAFIPTGSREPQAAWDFIQWFAATEEGTSILYRGTQLPPVYLKSPVLEQIKADPIGKPFRNVMFAARHSRPAMSVADFYTAQLEEQGSRALFGELTPYAAMKKVKDETQTELRRFLRETRMLD